MPDATITSTASTFGTISGVFSADQSTISGTISGVVPGTLTGSVGVPGPAGPAGIGLPAGGTSGQFLQKTSSVDYATDWVTVNLTGLATESWVTAGFYPLTGNPSSFLTASALTPYLTSATAASTYQTLSGMSSYLTTATAASTYYLQTNPAGYQTAANVTTALSPYLLSATASTTYAPIAAGQPVAGSTGQVLTKQSGTNYDSIWVTPVVGDRYLSSSTTSNTVSNGNKTFTIGTGLSYSPTQNITISYDASNHMHGEVLTYNSGTGVLTVDVNHHTGSGTYASWVVNVGGVTPATSVAWGTVTGTLSAQTDLQSALDLKLAATTAASTYFTIASAAGKANLSGATFTNDILVSSSPDLSTLGAGLLNMTSSANSYLLTISTVAGYPQIFFRGPTGDSTQTVAYPGPSGFLLKADNLSGLANTGTARTNLGLGTMATATAADYSTTTVANGLYYPLAGNPSAFLVAADITGKANLASPALTGTPTAPTATLGTNTTQIATTAFVLANAPAAPVTSVAGRTGAITLAVADVSGAAPLASPTFTGTPSLPTGTTAVTQTAGNNTTALATTAFVQQEVPAASTTAAGKVELATVAETITSNSTTLVPALDDLPAIITRPENRSINYINSTAVSGSGSASANTSGIREIFLSSLATGRSAFWLGVPGFNQTACLMSRANNQLIDFSKKIWVSGKSCAGFNIATNYMGDSNTMCRVTLGGYNANGTGDMVQKGIGWKKVGGTSPFFTLTVHNGTTLTDVATTVQQSDKKVIDWVIYSDGAGNVTLYIDGAQAAATSAGPTGTSTAGYSMYREQVEATATPTVRGILHSTGGHIYTEG